MTKRLTGRDIELWTPRRWNEVVGNYSLKQDLQLFAKTVNGPNGGQGINLLVLGSSRSGKTSTIELMFKAALCWEPSPQTDPCLNCQACRHDLGRHEVSGLWTFGWLAPNVKIGYQIIDGNTITTDGLDRIIADRGGERQERHFIWIDEIQGLVRRNLDHSLLKAVEQHKSITWIVSTATTKGLEPMFRNRFTEVRTEQPTNEDFVVFIKERCSHPDVDLKWDEPDTIIRLALRSQRIPGKAMKCLAKAKMFGKLTRSLVENYPFDLLDSE
jgi:hypothetical protein